MKKILVTILCLIMSLSAFGTAALAESSADITQPTTVNFNSSENGQIIPFPISENYGYWKLTVNNTTVNLIEIRIYKENTEDESVLNDSVFYGKIYPKEQETFYCEKDKPFESGNYYIAVNKGGTDELSGYLSYQCAASYDELDKLIDSSDDVAFYKARITATTVTHTVKYIPDNGEELSIKINIHSSRPVSVSIYKDDELVTDGLCIKGNDSYTYTYSGNDNKACEFEIRIHDVTNDGSPVDAEIIPSQKRTYSSWASTFISEAINQNKIPADLQNNYSSNITREEFCRIAYCFIDKYIDKTQTKSSFTDTDIAGINALANNGIINGNGNNTFAPNDNILREEAAAILERMAQKMSVTRATDFTKTYADESSISPYAISAVQNMTRLHIMDGKDNNNFCPKDLLTKEEAIAILVRLAAIAE